MGKIRLTLTDAVLVCAFIAALIYGAGSYLLGQGTTLNTSQGNREIALQPSPTPTREPSLSSSVPASSQDVNNQEISRPSLDRYGPAGFGIPDTISEYHILAVLNGGNFRCMKPEERRLIFQAPELTSESGLSEFPWESITNTLRALNLDEYADGQFSIVSPTLTREQLVNQLKQAYRLLRRNGCPWLQNSD